MFPPQLSECLLQAALEHGVTCGAMFSPCCGFLKGARWITREVSEIPATTLPICIELLAPKAVLEKFLLEQAHRLTTAQIVLFDSAERIGHNEHIPAVVEGLGG